MLSRIILIAILFSFNLQAKEADRMMNPFSLVSTELVKGMSSREAVFQFTFPYVERYVVNSVIQYSIDGVTSKVKLDSLTFKVKTTPGKHIFQIFISRDYREMYSDSLLIKGGFMDSYQLYPRWSEREVQTEKPVIYLYPEEKMDVSIILDVVGELSFTYPAYENGWNVSASPEGTIKVNESTYNYLFWESNGSRDLYSIDYTSGYIVKKDDVLSFLEEKLNLAGFTSKEKADFITYWGPRMIAHEKLFVQFTQNEDCNKYAELDISPKPDHVNRFYISWSSLPNNANFNITPQEIIPINREGFSILEWGGQEVQFVLNMQIN